MSVLVIGGSGYLGSILTDELINNNYEVIILDLNTPINKAIKFIKGDIRDRDILEKTIRDVDYLIHIAAIVGDAACNKDPQQAVETNYLGTKKIAEVCKDYKIKKAIYASTCSVYGIKLDICDENTEPEPFSLYGITKLAGEREILKLNDNAIVFRMATLFGMSPKMRYDLVVNEFIKKAKIEGRISVFGGKQKRPFLHIRDAAKAYVMSLEKNVNGVFNLSSINLSINELAGIIAEKTGCKMEFFEQITDKRSYYVSCEKARKILGFNPIRTIYDAIEEIK